MKLPLFGWLVGRTMGGLTGSPFFFIVLAAGTALALLTGTAAQAMGEPQSGPQAAPPYFYYYQGQRVALAPDESRVAARFRAEVTAVARQATLESLGDFVPVPFDLPRGQMSILALRAGHGRAEAMARLTARPEIELAAPVFGFPGGTYILTDEVIVRFRDSVAAGQRQALRQAHGGQLLRAREADARVEIQRVTSPKQKDALALANEYVESGAVEYAEPNFVILQPVLPAPPLRVAEPAGRETPRDPLVTPNDLYFGNQWALSNAGQFAGSQPGADIRATGAWNIQTGQAYIVIAIVDEGVDGTHPDLAAKMIAGYNVTDSGASSNTQPSSVLDTHGTEVAGVAAAATNNLAGIAGVCWGCKILPIKIAYEITDPQNNRSWYTTTAWLSGGIDRAWQMAADVLNNSWTMLAPSQDVSSAITNAYYWGRCHAAPCGIGDPTSFGSTIVFAAGNDPAVVGSISYPASLSYVIAAGASNWCDQRKTQANTACNYNETFWASQYGPGLDLLAPGINLYTTSNGGGYNYFDGTSAAAPLVAGAAALLYSSDPVLTPSQNQAALQAGADDLATPGWDSETGYGRLNAYRALQSLYDLAVATSDYQSTVRIGQTLTYTTWYTNSGLTATPNATMTITLPSGLAYNSSAPAFMDRGGGVYTYNLGALGAGSTGSTIFVGRVLSGTEGTQLTFTVQIATSQGELNTVNNTAVDTDTLRLEPLYLPLLGSAPPSVAPP